MITKPTVAISVRTIAVLLAVGLGIIHCGCSRGLLDLEDVAGTPGFRMTDNLAATIIKSSDQSQVGYNLTFVGLQSGAPKVVFAEDGMTSPVEKVSEGEKSVTLLLVASGTGSVDAFVIDKETGHFARASAGAPAGVYASASVGLCK